MEFKILGSVAVADGETDIAVPGVKLRTLLALLLIRNGEVTRAERLADDLWGEALPAGYQNALQSLISKLRRALGESGRRLVTETDGYRLDVGDDELDSRRFEVAVRQGHEHLAAGDLVAASTVLSAGLALWHGPALHGVGDEGVLQREAVRLEELRLGALEDRIHADLELGKHAELIAELTTLCADHPLRERLHGFLMLALYRCGRQSDALRAFQDARTVLVDELGLDPGPELRSLENSILTHDPALDLRSEPAPTRHRSNLTDPLSSFIGRAQDLASLNELVDAHRLITIVGPGGAGKTRLCVHMANARAAAPDTPASDVWLVELASIGAPSAVADTIASALGIADGATRRGGAPQAPEDRIVQHLASRAALLLLDNCEHVINEAARVAEALLVACPLLTIVATSREALGVTGEKIWRMPSMAIDDSVALFVDRAAAASGFVMTKEDEPVVLDLCTRLDGLPLAIELAAGRSRAFPVQQLAARLDDRFRLLTGGARTALPRQQTLRAVVEWSYELLFEHEQRVFDRLSVFSGGCSLEAAEAVCAGDDIDPADIADILGHLVDKSLVIADQSAGDVRFRLLQTLALFGRERLASSSDAHATRARHASHFAELCARGPAAFRGEAQESWLTDVERESDNLHVALTWVMEEGDARAAQTMLGGLGWSWWFAGRGDEGWRWITAGLECAGPTTPQARASAAIWACNVGATAGVGGSELLSYGWEALDLARGADDEELLVMTLKLLGDVVATGGDPTTGLTLLAEAAALTASRTDSWGRATHANAAGRCADLRGDLSAAVPLLRQALDLYDETGVQWAVATVGANLAMIAEREGDIDAAIQFAERARRAALRLRLGAYDAIMLARLGDYALWKGDRARADDFHRRAIEMADEIRYPNAKAMALAGQAVAHRQAGELDAAERDAATALAMMRSSGLWNGVPKMLATLGMIAEQRGHFDEAHTLHHRALRASRSASDGRAAALALEGLASLALVNSDPDRAARLLGGAAEQRRTRGGLASGPVSDVERITAEVHAELGASAFDRAFTAGAATPLAELAAG